MDSPSYGIYVPDWMLTQPIDKKESIMEIMRIGLDLAKNSFYLFILNQFSKPAGKKKLSRGDGSLSIIAFLGKRIHEARPFVTAPDSTACERLSPRAKERLQLCSSHCRSLPAWRYTLCCRSWDTALQALYSAFTSTVSSDRPARD